jgi:hypothetical protein
MLGAKFASNSTRISSPSFSTPRIVTTHPSTGQEFIMLSWANPAEAISPKPKATAALVARHFGLTNDRIMSDPFSMREGSILEIAGLVN